MGAERRTIELDGPALLEALVARDEGLLATYLDLFDGSFLRLFDPAITGRDNEAVLSRIDNEPDRFAEVPRYMRFYRLMTDFVDTVEDDHLARMLDTALTGRGAFRRFEAVLGGWPSEHGRWEAFRREALCEWAGAWLQSLGVVPEWSLPWPPKNPADVPLVLEVALKGHPDETGRRVWQAESDAAAVSLFLRLARQLCELRGEPFRARGLRAKTRFVRGGVAIVRQGSQVMLELLE